MKNILPILILSIFVSFCSSSQKTQVTPNKIEVYSKQEFAGTIAVDENGNPLSKGTWFTHLIYIELANEINITWDSLVINGKSHQIGFEKLKNSTILIGRDKKTNEKINLNSNKNYQYWLITLPEFQSDSLLNPFKATLFGKIDTKNITISIHQNVIELASELRP